MKTEEQKQPVHFTDSYLINPTNPIEVVLIGAGGTGSQLLTCLSRMNQALNELGHPGFSLTLWDDDRVTEANMGRQLFADCEVGMYKSVSLINRVNRFFGTTWKANTIRFDTGIDTRKNCGNVFFSCVDNAASRFQIAKTITAIYSRNSYSYTRPRYWLDFGNSQYTGQVILSTIDKIKQPNSSKFRTVDSLPLITDEFADLLKTADETDDTPSCSLAEALEKQDLFINSTLAQMGSSLFWNMLRHGLTEYRGFFLNLQDFRTQPIRIS